MQDKQFEPFQDRLSRDIRNDLSESLVTVLNDHSLAPAQKVARKYLDQELALCYRQYIEERLKRYQQALDNLGNEKQPIAQATILWDQGLFFEVHEVLEHAWLKAEGEKRLLLQALIRSAGVYIKLEHGYQEAAIKIAGKARLVLEEQKEQLRPYFVPEKLIKALQNPADPPTLLGD